MQACTREPLKSISKPSYCCSVFHATLVSAMTLVQQHVNWPSTPA